MKLAKYFRRGESRGIPSEFNQSWKKTQFKNKEPKKRTFKKYGNNVVSGVYDNKIINEDGDNNFSAVFNKPKAIGAIVTGVIGRVLQTYQRRTEEISKKIEEIREIYDQKPTPELAKELSQLYKSFPKPRFKLIPGRFRVVSRTYDNKTKLYTCKLKIV